MSKEMILCAVGTTKYLIVNEQVAERAILRSVIKIGYSPATVS